MPELTLSRESYRNKVHGGWLGKSIGGTLGAPFDGSTEIRSLTFFDPLPGQAAASDGMDFELVWLNALRREGPSITAEKLAAAWQEHIAYPWDEYGYAAHNVRRGLKPAMTGFFDNWFRDSARAVGRCDLWGMLLPGAPQEAALRAYADASIDHSGEGVWAAMFWAAIESAAFFVSDASALLDTGLAMVPQDCRIARAVRIVRDAHREGATPLDARSRVLAAVGVENWSDAPQNVGFTVLGWLYGGGDFGASLLTAVNCGYAAQINGGVLGATLGIIASRDGIPSNWLEPVGESVVLGWGVHDLAVEHTADELAAHTVEAGEQFIAACCPHVRITDSEEPGESLNAAVAGAGASTAPTATPPAHFLELDPDASTLPQTQTPESLPDDSHLVTEESGPEQAHPAEPGVPTLGAERSLTDAEPAPEPAEPAPSEATPPLPPPQPTVSWQENEKVRPLWSAPSGVAVYHAGPFELTVDYGSGGPVLLPGVASSFTVAIRNLGSEPFLGHVRLGVPEGWQVAVPGAQGQRQMLAAGRMARYGFVVKAPENAPLKTRNFVTLVLAPENGPATTAEIAFFGGGCWWFVGPFRNLGDEGYEHAYGPEDVVDLSREYLARDGGLARWQKEAFGSVVMDLEDRYFRGIPGVAYGLTTLHLPAPAAARVVANSSDGVKVWVNNQRVLQRHSHEPFRPTLGYGPAQADVELKAGENRVLVKAVRCTEPLGFSFVVADREGRPLLELGNTRW